MDVWLFPTPSHVKNLSHWIETSIYKDGLSQILFGCDEFMMESYTPFGTNTS